MEHLTNFAGGKSYSTKKHVKFKVWYQKCMMAQVPILACLVIEVLLASKTISKTFQLGDVEQVTIQAISGDFQHLCGKMHV